MKYTPSPELQSKAEEISRILFPHIDMTRVKCFISEGSSTKRTIARCHTLGKVMQLTIGVPAYYALEFISKNFNKLSEEEKTKTIIHELMHIPKAFGGGFRHHDHVCEKNVNLMFKTYMAKTEQNSGMRKWFQI